ncbi:unnamed protein product [Phytomonas sp. Hart1]|nr:unnamed protein product [Phytomonas sp. Hart1]|eukprot:CCW66987.1 unnamed protein product [Phytomonas sp. isolate Hart1]
MGHDGESDGLNKATSSHSSSSHPNTYEGQWYSEALSSVFSFDMVSVDENYKNSTLKDVERFSSALENTSLEEEVKYPTLLGCLQKSIINSSHVPKVEEKEGHIQTYTQMSANDSLGSEHASKDVVKDSFEHNQMETNAELSRPQKISLNFRRNSCSIPIVNGLDPMELKEADKHPGSKHSKLGSVFNHPEDKGGYSNGILDHTDGYCCYNHLNKGDGMAQHKTPALNGAIKGMNDMKRNFIGQPGDGSTMPKWQKILYEKQPFEDNYVDPQQFLEDLRQNEHLTTYEYTEVVKNTFAITQQISIVILFACAFSMLLNQTMNHYTILYVDLAVFFLTIVVYFQLKTMRVNYTGTQNYVLIHLSQIPQASSSGRDKKETRVGGRHKSDIKRTSTRSDNASNGVRHRSMNRKHGLAANTGHNGSPSFHGEDKLVKPELPYADSAFGFFRKTIGVGTMMVLLTPILSTLTASFSNDTIVALSIFTMSLHVLTTDYSYLNAYTTGFSPNLSVNAASFGVIMVASRIPNPLDSGALIAFGSFCFSLSPIVRHYVRRTSFTAHVVFTLLLFVINTGCLLTIPVLVILYVTCILMISFVIPWWFVSLHSSVKNQINGPWDEAKPTNSAAAAEWANAGLLS